MLKCILNDQIIDQDNAFVHVTDLSLLRAYGVFDFFRLVNLQPLFFDDHIERFFNSADKLRLKCPVGRKQLKSSILEIISLNSMSNSGIRIVLTGGESDTGYSIGKPTLFVLNEPINPLPKDHFSKGIKLISHQYQRDLPEVKSINYIVGIFKKPEIQEKGALDLLFHWEGKISEVTRSNFFFVDQNDKIITAGKGVLRGINRKHVLKTAEQQYEIEERDLFMDELSNAKEAFITGTTKKVMPVYQIDDVIIGDGKAGPITKNLQTLYEKYISDYLLRNQ